MARLALPFCENHSKKGSRAPAGTRPRQEPPPPGKAAAPNVGRPRGRAEQLAEQVVIGTMRTATKTRRRPGPAAGRPPSPCPLMRAAAWADSHVPPRPLPLASFLFT